MLLIYRVVVRPLVFGTIRAVAERLQALLKLTFVRSLSGVRSLVDFQIFQAREGLVATGELIRPPREREEEKREIGKWLK